MEEITRAREQLLDDCVAMVEALRCLRDKGAEAIDEMGVTLTEEAFDRCFPGVEWTPVTADGTVIAYIKEAEYRRFHFVCVKDAEEDGR